MERTCQVLYQGVYVGYVRADIVLDNNLVLELKTVAKITDAHFAQLHAYMRCLIVGVFTFGHAYSAVALLNCSQVMDHSLFTLLPGTLLPIMLDTSFMLSDSQSESLIAAARSLGERSL